MKQFLETGKIVGTHGVRGMVRIQPWCDDADFLCGFDRIYINGGERELTVEKIQPHGTVVIAAFAGVDSIEKAEAMRGSVIYIKREDAVLEEGRYFVDDIIGCAVFDVDSGEPIGEIVDVSFTGANDVWHIRRDGRQYLIPKIDDVVKDVDISAGRVLIKPMKGLFDDEN